MPNSLKLKKGKLTETKINQYWKDGYLFPLTFTSALKTKQLCHSLEKIEKDYSNVKMARTLNAFKRMDEQCLIRLA